MRANREKADALLDLELKGNKDAIDKKYDGKSDDDVIADKFGDGSNGASDPTKSTGDKGD